MGIVVLVSAELLVELNYHLLNIYFTYIFIDYYF